MEEEPKDVIVLGSIKKGAKKFDKIQKDSKLNAEELNSILEKLEERGLIEVEEKKSWFGKKTEIRITDKGSKEVDERVHELQEKWNQMSMLYKGGDKQKLKQYMDDNKSILPMMMFFGVIDMIMFTTMFSMMGTMMTDYVPVENMPSDMGDTDSSADIGDSDAGGFDIDVGF